MNKLFRVIITFLVTTLLCACSESEPDIYTLYKCTESSSIRSSRTYYMEMRAEKKDKTKFLLSNIVDMSNDGNNDIEIKITNKSISISPKSFDTVEMQLKSGSGTINADTSKINLDYIMYNGTSTFSVKAVLIKQ